MYIDSQLTVRVNNVFSRFQRIEQKGFGVPQNSDRGGLIPRSE